MSRLRAGIGGILAGLLIAAPAVALPVTLVETFAISDPDHSLVGTLNPVAFGGFDFSAGGVTCLVGTCTPLTQDIFIFSITITVDSLSEVGFSLFDEGGASVAVGMGFFPFSENPDPFSASLAVSTAPRFTFNPTLSTATTDPMFATYTLGTLPNEGFGPFEARTGAFMIRQSGATADFTEMVVVTPEPAALLLFAVGLTTCAALARRR